MGILVILCFGLLIGHTRAEIFHTVYVQPKADGGATEAFSQTLQCESGTNVYIANIVYNYPISCCQQSQCSAEAQPSDVGHISATCWTSSDCTVEFAAPQGSCNPTQAVISFVCAPVNSSLTINQESAANGSDIIAATASGGSGNALWECSMEPWDCSRVNVTLALIIRNGNDTASYFSLPGTFLDKVGERGVKFQRGTFQTPFSVFLNVIPGSALLNAYFAAQAGTSISVTCGRRPTPEPTSSYNVSIVSTPPSSISGHELTAVHSSSGEERAGDWVCVVETADCSTGTPVQVAFYVSNRPCGNASYFSWNGSQVDSGSTVTVTTPLAVTLHLDDGARVRLAYFSVAAHTNVTVRCGRNANSTQQEVQYQCAACQSSPCQGIASCVPSPGSFQCVCPAGFHSSSDGLSCLDINECTTTPPPCDVTAHCNNTEGSFRCYCDPGYRLMDNNKGCTDINECTEMSACDVTAHCNNTEGSFHCYCDPGKNLTDNGKGCQGGADGAGSKALTMTHIILIGVFGALGFFCIVAVVVCCVRKCRTRPAQKKVVEPTTDTEAPTDKGHNNSSYAYTEVTLNRGFKASTNAAPLANSANGQPDAVYGYDKLGQKRKPTDVKSGGVYGCLDVNAEGNTNGNAEGNTKGNTEGNTMGHSNSSCVYSQVSRDRKAPLAAAPLADSADSQPEAVYNYDKLGQKKKPADGQNVYGSLTGNTEGNTKENTEGTTVTTSL